MLADNVAVLESNDNWEKSPLGVVLFAVEKEDVRVCELGFALGGVPQFQTRVA